MKISAETSNRLFNLLLHLGQTECKLESLRNSLSSYPFFVPYEAFQFLDSQGNGFLSADDIYYFLKLHKYSPDKYSCFYALKEYDSTNSNTLKFKDFLNIVLPKDDSNLRFEVVQRTNREADPQSLPLEIEAGLSKLLFSGIESLKEIEKLRSRLVTRFDFDPHKAFEVVDLQGKGYLDFETIEEYFEGRKEVVAGLMRKLDLNGDCKISYLEFLEGITPFIPKTKVKPLYMGLTETFLSKVQHVNDVEVKVEETVIKKTVVKKSIQMMKGMENGKPKSRDKEIEAVLRVLREEMKQENKIDAIKQSLALREDFMIKTLYEVFGRKENLVEWLREIGFSKDAEEYTKVIYDRFGEEGKVELSKERINDIFVPLQDKYAKLMLNKSKGKAGHLGKGTVKLIQELLKAYSETYENIKKLKEGLPKDPELIKEVFCILDKKHAGHFSYEDVILAFPLTAIGCEGVQGERIFGDTQGGWSICEQVWGQSDYA
eukprot:TRINITY_DN3847_c1_g1_i1.p1 TRINITY_DN3847_c1_g1~~TRINITY_DN3847_c1_g1_i1.p1  ORF type:complete len:517 (-),score=71.12 TRINITY_DN3847_c1_g1_i1:2401-3864(-)